MSRERCCLRRKFEDHLPLSGFKETEWSVVSVKIYIERKQRRKS